MKLTFLELPFARRSISLGGEKNSIRIFFGVKFVALVPKPGTYSRTVAL